MGTGRLFACSLVRHKTDGHRYRYQVQQPHYITWRYHRYNTEFLVKDTGTILCTWKYNIMVHASSNSRCLLLKIKGNCITEILAEKSGFGITVFVCLVKGFAPVRDLTFQKEKKNVQGQCCEAEINYFRLRPYIAT